MHRTRLGGLGLPVKRIMTGSIPMSMPGVGSDGSGDDSEVDSEDADDWGW